MHARGASPESVSGHSSGRERKMIHIPQTLESTAQQWVETYQEAWGLMEKISQTCLERFFKAKERERGKGP